MSQYSNNVSFQAPTDYGIEQQAVERQRKLAEAMMMRSQQPQPSGQMVGTHYVPQSWTQGLAQALQGPAAAYKQNQADEKSKDIAGRQRAAYAAELEKFGGLMSGTPAQTIQPLTPNDDDGNVNAPAEKPAMAGDRRAALAMALGAQNPMLQQVGMQQMMKGLDAKWEKAELPNADGSKRVGYVNVNSQDPLSTFQAGGTAPVKLEGVNTGGNTTFVNPFAPKAEGAPVVGATGNQYKDLLVTGPDGKPMVNSQMLDAKKQIAQAGKSTTSVSVNTEKGYAGEIAKGLAKADLDTIDAASAAGDRIRSAQSVRALLDKNPITGTGAEARLSLNKALTTAGLIDGKQVRDTETLGSLLASSTLDAIKTSGLGSGQGFTDKDRAFLERAKSGNLEINPATLRDLADLNERAARSSIAKGRRVASKLANNPTMGTVGQDFNFDEPPPAAAGGQPANNGFSIKRLP